MFSLCKIMVAIWKGDRPGPQAGAVGRRRVPSAGPLRDGIEMTDQTESARTRITRRVFIYGACAGSIITAAGMAHAADYPSRPVKALLPFSPGGSADTLNRIVCDALAKKWGQSVVIENRAGGNTIIATTLAVNSAPDGYTIYFTGDQTITINPLLYPAPYDVGKDLVPVTLIAAIPLLLVVRKDFPANSLAEFLKYAQENPGRITYGSSGPGSIQRLAIEALASMAGVRLLHVPYKGSNEAVTAMLSGEIDANFNGIANFVEHLKVGRLKALAISTAKRSDEVPDVPAVAEAGGAALAAYDLQAWFGFFMPRGTPPEIVTKIQKDVAAIVVDPMMAAGLKQRGFVAVANTPAEFKKIIDQDTARWRKLVDNGQLTKE